MIQKEVLEMVLARRLFASLQKLSSGTYVILIDGNFEATIPALTDREAIREFEKWINKREEERNARDQRK